MTSSLSSIHSFSFPDPRFRPSVARYIQYTNPNLTVSTLPCRFSFMRLNPVADRRRMTAVMAAGPMFFAECPIVGDMFAMVFSGGFALSILRVYEETATIGVFEHQKRLKASLGGVEPSCDELLVKTHAKKQDNGEVMWAYDSAREYHDQVVLVEEVGKLKDSVVFMTEALRKLTEPPPNVPPHVDALVAHSVAQTIDPFAILVDSIDPVTVNL